MPELISLESAWMGVLTYLIAHLFHVTLWHVGETKSDVKLLFCLLFFIPSAVYLNLILKLGVDSRWVAPFIVHVILAMNYIAIYPAFQASSPTVHILTFLKKAGRSVSEVELIEKFGRGGGVVKDRLADLKQGGLVQQEGQLTLKGKLLARIFITYRQILGLPMGAG
jgi:hypothetical protein